MDVMLEEKIDFMIDTQVKDEWTEMTRRFKTIKSFSFIQMVICLMSD